MSDKSVISSIRLPVDLREKVKDLAEGQRRSFSSVCAYFIEQGFKREIKAIEKAKGSS